MNNQNVNKKPPRKCTKWGKKDRMKYKKKSKPVVTPHACAWETRHSGLRVGGCIFLLFCLYFTHARDRERLANMWHEFRLWMCIAESRLLVSRIGSEWRDSAPSYHWHAKCRTKGNKITSYCQIQKDPVIAADWFVSYLNYAVPTKIILNNKTF